MHINNHNNNHGSPPKDIDVSKINVSKPNVLDNGANLFTLTIKVKRNLRFKLKDVLLPWLE